MITKLLVSMIMAVPILLLVQDPLSAQVKVTVAPVVLLSNEPLRTYAGTVEPFQNVTIQSKVAGRIAGIKVDENQRVKKGEVLLSLSGKHRDQTSGRIIGTAGFPERKYA